MIELQIQLNPNRDMLLFWGVTDTSDFYHLDHLQEWFKNNPNLKIWLAARNNSNGFKAPEGMIFKE